MANGKSNKRYTPEFKKTAIEAVREQIKTGVEVSAVLCTGITFGIVSLAQEENKANVRCTAILRVLYLDEGGALLMFERRIEAAARITAPEGCMALVRSVTAACQVSATATADGIEVRFPAVFTLECTCRRRCTCLCTLKAKPREEGTGDRLSLVLRAKGAEERFWDLAKAYRTTVAEILAANELTAESDAPDGEMLLIPCRPCSEGLGYREASRQLEINSHRRICGRERLYLTESPEAFAIERRGCGGTGAKKTQTVQKLRKKHPCCTTVASP